MPKHSSDIQYLLDRAAIHDLHARYFQGIDRNDPDQVRSCFTGDVVARYDGRSALRSGSPSPARGIDALMDALLTFKKKASGEWKVTTHFMANMNFAILGGDVAETEINAIAFIVLAGDGPEQVAMRSLRYLDKLRRTDAGWRIAERVHTLDWSCQVPTVFSVSMAERLMARPQEPSGAGNA